MTDEQIKEHARIYAKLKVGFDLSEESYYNNMAIDIFNTYVNACKWMQSQSQWIPVSERLPLAFETGNWDGKRSDKILVHTKDDRYFVAVLYEGILDGNEFHDFYDDRDFEIKDVKYWKYI